MNVSMKLNGEKVILIGGNRRQSVEKQYKWWKIKNEGQNNQERRKNMNNTMNNFYFF